uniref:NEDD8 ultimate buster 1-like n=1 Tax=Crassostrea virginica TaxID=6565 RepID=A0A8B8CZB4_CRAVI|nr:NEDD8 ultimate buster 1-like [Crassostrea virginica]XP_022320915.1 NEDD8 ultimate buster 1-like [Crassostrea virginica]
MAQSTYEKELQTEKIRKRLNADQIKLWLPPYTTTDKKQDQGNIPEDLCKRYSSDLNIPAAITREILEHLRQHALQKLVEREQFQKTGKAVLKIKASGLRDDKEKISFSETIEIILTKTGHDLRQIIAEKLGLPAQRLKIICRGHVINLTTSLQDQNVKHGSQMMCLCLSVSEAEAAQKEEEVMQMMNTRQAAELLSRRVEKDDFEVDIQIADQSGRPLKLPAEEKKALTLAMTLHEKGRAAIKRKEITKALLLLLEADKEFRKCRANILSAVDNHAVLGLDIVWCYLCLQNVEELPDADQRLRSSEECFIRSYGANLERVAAVKGESGTQLALYMKLHLLQGIVAFHQHRIPEAQTHLMQAQEELKKLLIDENKLSQVMVMGFGEREGRLGLRATNGDVTKAIQHIIERRKEKEEIEKKVKEERRQKKIQRNLGKTASGERVNVSLYENLVHMGYSQGASAAALRQTNNDLNQALEVLQLHPELMNLPDPERKSVRITDDMIAQVVAMGFDTVMASRALHLVKGDVQKALDELIQKGGIIPPSPDDSSDGSPEAGPSHQASEEEARAIRDLVSDLPQDEEDYLDLTLQEEAQYLEEYLAKVNSIVSADTS